MTSAFMVLIITAILQRLFKTKNWRLKGHKLLGGLSAIIVLIGFSIAFYYVSSYSATHFNYVHAYVGLLAIILSILVSIIGYERNLWKTNRIGFRNIHIAIAVIVAIVMIIAIVMGLQLVYP
jgi:uncharacterized membrane protein YidH (DUF202 family)